MMSPHEFSDALIKAYQDAGKPKYPNSRIRRGENRSVASEIEDLLAFYLAENLTKIDEIWVNQPLSISVSGGNRMRVKPDLTIIRSDIIRGFVELKMDVGYARKDVGDSFAKTRNRIRKIRGKNASFKNGKSAEGAKSEIRISSDVDCIFVIVSGKNASRAEYEAVEMAASKHKVPLHTLLRDIHPNNPILKDKKNKCAKEMGKSLIILRDAIGEMVA